MYRIAYVYYRLVISYSVRRKKHTRNSVECSPSFPPRVKTTDITRRLTDSVTSTTHRTERYNSICFCFWQSWIVVFHAPERDFSSSPPLGGSRAASVGELTILQSSMAAGGSGGVVGHKPQFSTSRGPSCLSFWPCARFSVFS